MELEKLKEWLGFLKFFLGTFIIGVATFLVNRDIQYREIEIKEQEQVAKYIEHAIHEDVGLRLRFAQYFRNVTRSDVLRERWAAYLSLVQAEYDKKEKEKEALEREVNRESLSGQEREALMARIAVIEEALNPAPKQSTALLPSRIYMHVQSETDKIKAQDMAALLKEGGFSVPGIQVLDKGPSESELRYFRKRELEYVESALSLLGDLGRVKLRYVPGYENSTAIRERHFEIWLSKDAFD